MADNIKYRFIQNIGDYFPAGYFNEDFIDRVQKAAGLSSDQMDEFVPRYRKLKAEYDKYKNYLLNSNPRIKDAIKHTHDFNSLLLETLGYNPSEPYSRYVELDEEGKTVVPVRHVLSRNGHTTMLVMEMQNLVKTGDEECPGLFEQRYDTEDGETVKVAHQRYSASQWSQVFRVPEDAKISPAVINKAVDALFLLPQERRPKFILMLAGNELMLLDAEKWSRGAWLQFSLDELFSQASINAFRKYYALFHLLVSKDTLADDSDTVLMDTLIEESYKNAYEVTKDLKEGVIMAVETLANEALHYMRDIARMPFGKYNPETGSYDETDDAFEAEVKDDCLTMIYRLLFIFYAESRPELEILPTNDEVYKQGYSLEMMRDLEQARLNSQESRDGYFFDESIRALFRLLNRGFKEEHRDLDDKSFSVRKIDSPLFDDKRLKHLDKVKIRNSEWQKIICALSLSKKNGRYGRGRISYANLGVNQLGSVYESLLAYRGFYAEEDYIEVYKPGKLAEGTFLVPYSRIDDFHADEILYEEGAAHPVIHKKGTFIYRLNGRDRQKSASYYTPEVLTRSTVKYTLKAIIDEVAEGKREASDLLKLKILEPAMGAAAFQNEVINQIAEAYLTYKQRETGKRISPDQFLNERQKVKAYIATHNVYGVDLNPTAVELGKLALWLNVMHRDMETPFFAGRLAVGNAVIGAWLKTFNRNEVVEFIERKGRKEKHIPNPWWDKAPRKVKFFKTRVNRLKDEVYHFLLPDPGMLAVTGIKEHSKTDSAKLMKEMIKQWKSPLSEADFTILQRLSAKIDYLLKEHFRQQSSIDKITSNISHVWDGINHADQGNVFGRSFSYISKQEVYDTRFSPTSAYYRLQLVMDYWCALWFWPLEGASSVPTREQYWKDIEKILNVDDSALNETFKTIPVQLQASLFDDEPQEGILPGLLTVEEPEVQMETRTQLLAKYKTGTDAPAPIDEVRFALIRSLSQRYHFFHPMLEFIEVFWQRGGFDVIAGNPPWLKLEFEIQNVISEKFPEVLIREIDATEVEKHKDLYLADSTTATIVHDEELETFASSVFLNAYQNYPLLLGQQTDLYKCVLQNSLESLSEKGFLGMLHPESIYDDPKGQPCRKVIYKRLRYHFQYQNALNLFPIAHRRKYGSNIYGPLLREAAFDVINNLFHPNTIDASYAHNGLGECGGIKTAEGEWNVNGHRDRIIHYSTEELKLLSNTFEDGENKDCPKMVSIHQQSILSILKKLSSFVSHVKDVDNITTVCFDETGAPKAGLIRRNTIFPNEDHYEMILNAPQFYVANPYYKTPKEICTKKGDFETLDLEDAELIVHQRTNYVPSIPESDFIAINKGFLEGQDSAGNDTYGNWLNYYKVGFRKMINQSGERSLIWLAFRPACRWISTLKL